MFDNYSSMNLAKAISEILEQIMDYINEIKQIKLKTGICVISPKSTDNLNPPSDEQMIKIKEIAEDHFKSDNLHHLYLSFFVPPNLTKNELQVNQKKSIDNYILNFKLSEFDQNYEKDLIEKALIYCPFDNDLGNWHEFFIDQEEAVRLTPTLDADIIEEQIFLKIKMKLLEDGATFFKTFIKDYCKNDLNIRIEDRKQPWIFLYPELKRVFSFPNTLQNIYISARKIFLKSKNIKIKDLCKSLADYIENKLINDENLPQDKKNFLIAKIRNHRVKQQQKCYNHKTRPAIVLSYQDYSKFLYKLITIFCSDSFKYELLGEIILFLWICQQAAFSDLNFQINDILKIKIQEVDFQKLTIQINKQEANITSGIAKILIAWIGTNNKSTLFKNLNYEKLEENIVKYSKGLFGENNYLHPRDFIKKVHPLGNVRISYQIRRRLDDQILELKKSLYLIDYFKIKKDLKDTLKKDLNN
jgi:hypothetical protein